MNIAKENSYIEEEAKASMNIAIIEAENGNYKTAAKLFNKTKEIYIKLKKNNKIKLTLYNIAYLYNILYKYDKVNDTVDEFLNYQEKNELPLRLANIYIIQSEAFFNKSEYYKSIEVLEKALNINKDNDDLELSITISLYLSNCYREIENWEKTEEYLNSIKSINELKKLNQKRALYYETWARYFYDKENYSKAKNFIEKSKHIIEKTDEDNLKASLYNLIGKIDYKTKDYKSASEYFEKSFKLSEKLLNKILIANNLIFLGCIDMVSDLEDSNRWLTGMMIARDVQNIKLEATAFYEYGEILISKNDSTGKKIHIGISIP